MERASTLTTRGGQAGQGGEESTKNQLNNASFAEGWTEGQGGGNESNRRGRQ